VYHLELREFPHSTHAYNLDAARLRATVLDAWIAGAAFELGGREWVPERTTLTILEGDELPVAALSSGRGWPNARRNAREVTAQVLEAAATGGRPAPDPDDADREAALARDLLLRCASGPLSLAAVWARAEVVVPDADPGAWLVLALAAVRKLLTEGRIELCRTDSPTAGALPLEESEPLLRTREAWTADRPTAPYIRTAR
jgi:hypothetical protein